MTRKERYQGILDYFAQAQPEVETELNYSNPYELIVAVALSAQCTDKRVNMVTPKIFEDFPTVAHLAATHFDELFPYIKSISYPNNKTKHLIGMAKMLVEDFNSEVPATVEELVKLPGVGRKTANVIVSVIYNQPAMAVDTHVFRVSKRMGLVNQNASTPLEVEKQLMRHIPKEVVPKAHHWLILHGRYICLARKPKCEDCKISAFCRSFEKGAFI
ncbi:MULTISPECIES: endonuclease III [Persicobacter]|uniref:Endonuclease III n=1 Tax=Persicobacter diffluens TaxID=981 RepID=A0AAN5AK72_9BACT|nr:endonuclease III [Persicobacter sp. CCB-QB2]GJM59608.1 endonuclease III [Persicobacter diffluens]